MLTRDLIRNLCSKLGHDDAAPIIIKKVVAENLLDKVDDLRYVPRSRVEHWEVPLKLVDEIYDFVIDVEATALASGASAWVNYTLRPTLNQYIIGPIGSTLEALRDSAMKRKYPERWAARRILNWYRYRKRERAKLRDQLKMSKALRGFDTRNDFRRLSDRDSESRRRQRAKDRIRRAVRAWVERRRSHLQGAMDPEKMSAKDIDALKARHGSLDFQILGCEAEVWISHQRGGSEQIGRLKLAAEASEDRYYASLIVLRDVMQKEVARPSETETIAAENIAAASSLIHAPGLASAFVRMSEGKVKDCDVSKLLFRVCQKLNLNDEEVLTYFHKLVTQNWIEGIDDLDLVADKHWEAWRFPEKIVILLKQELREHQESQNSRATDVILSVGTGIRDMASVASSWIFGSGDDNDDGSSHKDCKKDDSGALGKDAASKRSSAKSSAKRASSEKPLRTERL
mmetsp:Transcript_50354/g.79801  ORF Transcript_50354/g.79801 Transcript_50354/m.79801 type:complete len:457 (+) Transcript_50354:44-1414(+)